MQRFVLCVNLFFEFSANLDEGSLGELDHRDAGLFRLMANGVNYLDQEVRKKDLAKSVRYSFFSRKRQLN